MIFLRGLPVVCDDASVCVELVGEGDVHVPAVHLRPLDHEAEMRILHECGEREAGYPHLSKFIPRDLFRRLSNPAVDLQLTARM